jgi:hypothetical protein
MLHTMALFFILQHVLLGDDVAAAGGGDEDVADLAGLIHGHDLVAFHGRLERADGIDFGHDDAGALAAQGLHRALAHVAEARHHRHLARDHHVGRAVDGVNQRVPAAVQVVELGLGHGVVDVEGGEQQLALLHHLVQAVHARWSSLRSRRGCP